MLSREDVEKLMVSVSRQREEAEAVARQAADDLVRQASQIRPLLELDVDVIRAAADTFVDSLQRFRELDQFARDLRGLLT